MDNVSKGQGSFLPRGCPVVSTQFVENIILSSIELLLHFC